jgi:RimJ/RimL family protein N-acetyltransferase
MSMLETEDLLLDKGRFSDWEAMYRNVWSRPESARYMSWRLTADKAEAPDRMRRTIAFQQTHDTYLIYAKADGQAIGFTGVEDLGDGVFQEFGVCLGPDYVGRGYGRQVLERLIRYCREEHGAREFRCSARAQNAASNALIRSLGFQLTGEESCLDERDGSRYRLLHYSLSL